MQVRMIYDSEDGATFVEVPTLEAYNGGKAHVHIDDLMATARALGAGFFPVVDVKVVPPNDEIDKYVKSLEPGEKKKHKKKEKEKKKHKHEQTEIPTEDDGETGNAYVVYMSEDIGELRKATSSRVKEDAELKHIIIGSGKPINAFKKKELAAMLERSDQRMIVKANNDLTELEQANGLGSEY